MTDAKPRPFASLLHLSDTHLGVDFADAGGPTRTGVRASLRSKTFQFFEAHDKNILLWLPSEIRNLAQLKESLFRSAWGKEYEEKYDSSFDRVIVTGDISTDANNRNRFGFAFEYLTAQVEACKEIHSTPSEVKVGLQIPKRVLLCVPGNHDKMLETTPERYYSAFSHCPEPRNYVTFIKRYGRGIVFLGIDSNDYSPGNIAMGRVDEKTLEWLKGTFLKLEKQGIKVGREKLTPAEYRTAIRCLILHHHPVDLSKFLGLGRLFAKKEWLKGFAALQGADKLLKIIAGKIDIVLHGHKHLAVCFPHEDTGIVVVSAGSTSQWCERPWYWWKGENSFFLITLFTDNTVKIEKHVWMGSGFKTESDWCGKPVEPLKLTRLQTKNATSQ